MSKGKNQHVVKHPDGWAVKGEGNSKATKVTETQKQAIEAAEQIAKNQKSEIRYQNSWTGRQNQSWKQLRE